VSKDFDSREAINHSARDNAESGYCGRGTYNILKHMGLPATNGNGSDWDDTLPKNGWIKVTGITPETAPAGSVIVYENDAEMGKANRGTGGGSYGHVEVVAEIGGVRRYVSDAARTNYGGTVPDNFEGVYIHPSMMTAEQASEYAVVARKSSEGGWIYQSGTEAIMDDPSNSAAFDGVNLSEMFTLISSIFKVLFQGISVDDATQMWKSSDKEVGQFEDSDPEAQLDTADVDAEIGTPLVSMGNNSNVETTPVVSSTLKSDMKIDL
jgi:hypothetical protein